MFTLIIEDKHGGIADEYSFEEGEFYIGRSHTSDIILPSDNVSRRHARLYVVDGKCYIEDLASSNGVFVNGRRINEVYQIQRSAQIKVGDYYLHIESDADQAAEEEKTWCKLTGRNLAFANQVFRVTRKVNLIGRGKDCTLTIIDPSVSRIHSKLSVERSGALTLEDLKSSNGTFVNDERVEVATVHHRDIIRIGNVEFLVEIPDQEGSQVRGKPAAKPESKEREIRRDKPRDDDRVRDFGRERAPAAATGTSTSAFDEEWPPRRQGSSKLVWIIVGASVAIIATIVLVAFKDDLFGGSTPAPTPAPVATTPPQPAGPTPEEKEAEEKKAKEREQKEIEAMIDVGNDYIKNRVWDKARERFQEVVKRDPLNDKARQALNRISEWEADKGRLDEARKMRDALKRGEAARRLREIVDTSVYYADAQDELRGLMQAKPTLELTADNLLRQKDCTGALTTLKEVALIDPKDATVQTRIEEIGKLQGTRRCTK